MGDFDPTFETEDRGAVATLLESWSPDFSDTSVNWRGVAAPNRRLDPPAQPGEAPEKGPTVVLGWRLEYTDVQETFEEDPDPYRSGHVIFRVSVDIGAGDGIAWDTLFPQLRRLAKGDTSGKLTYFPGAAKPKSLGVRGDWWVDELWMPFTGGTED